MCRARRAGYKSLLIRGDVYDIAYKLTCELLQNSFRFLNKGLKYYKKGEKHNVV